MSLSKWIYLTFSSVFGAASVVIGFILAVSIARRWILKLKRQQCGFAAIGLALSGVATGSGFLYMSESAFFIQGIQLISLFVNCVSTWVVLALGWISKNDEINAEWLRPIYLAAQVLHVVV